MCIRIVPLGPEKSQLAAGVWCAANGARRPGVVFDPVIAKTLIDARMADPSSWFLAAVERETPVGVLHGLRAREADGASERIVPGLMHLSMLAVIPSRWGGGIGRLLLQHGLALAKERDEKTVQLWVATDNFRAIGLYRACGFTPSGREKIDERGERIAHFSIGLRDLLGSERAPSA